MVVTHLAPAVECFACGPACKSRRNACAACRAHPNTSQHHAQAQRGRPVAIWGWPVSFSHSTVMCMRVNTKNRPSWPTTGTAAVCCSGSCCSSAFRGIKGTHWGFFWHPPHLQQANLLGAMPAFVLKSGRPRGQRIRPMRDKFCHFDLLAHAKINIFKE